MYGDAIYTLQGMSLIWHLEDTYLYIKGMNHWVQ